MVKGKYRIYWFSIFLILLSFAFVITFDVYKALGTIITLDALDESAGDYTVTQYDGYSVISITQGGEYTLTQNDIDTAVKTNIIVESEEPVTILLDGVNIHAGDYEQKSVFNDHQMGTGAISIQGNTDCKIILADDTINTIVGRTFYNGGNTAVDNSFLHTAAISVENSIVDGVVRLASVTIEGESGLDSNGILNATGGRQAAAIGGNNDRLTGNITINSGVINATSGDFGAAIGDGDTVRTNNGGMLWTVGQTNSISKIVINGGEVWAIATTDTPGIGTADELISGINATADVWTGMEIEINGGSIVSVGGGEQYNPSSAIGAGSNTNLSSSNIVINIGTDENPTQIIAVTQTKQGSFPVSNVGGSSIPALSTESSASVLNIKFDSSKIASHLDFWYLVDPTYSTEPTTEFPNSILERMGDINVLGMAVVLPEGVYRVTQDTDGDGADPDDPILADDLVVGGDGATTCEEQSDKTLICRYPLELRSPIDVVVFEKSPASFDVEVTKKSDGSTISYHWFMSSDEGNHWVSIDNETSSEYLIDETSLEMNGYLFRCDVTENINGEISTLSSKEARLTVLDLPKYDFNINLLLDGNKYTDNSSDFDLYDTIGNKILDLTNTNGVLNGAVKAGTYKLYVDGVDLGKDYVLSDTDDEYDINYYSVNLNVISNNDKDTVTLSGETFNSGVHSKTLILMDGKSFNISALADVDSELIKFTINSDEQDINELVNGYSMNVNSKTDVVVEFELKDYQSEINVYLDNAIYTDITGSFELRNDNDTFELENTNGVLSGTITAGSYKLYRDNKVINENIVISSSVNNNRVDYYSVDLELSSTDTEDEVLINGKSYKASKDAVVIALKGDEVTVKAVPNAERKLVAYSVNNQEDSIEDLLKEDTLVINEKTKLYVEFDVVLYDVTLNTYLDNEIFDANEAIYELYDESGRLVSQLTGGNGVYSDSLPKGKYYLYENSSDLNYEINVTKDSEYERHFYTVSLELVNPLGNNVGIGGNAYDSSFDKLLVYSAGDKISVEAYTDSVTEVVKYTVNGTDASFDDKVTVDKPIKLYVEFDYIDFDIKINVNLDDELFTDVDYEYSLYKDGTKVIDLTNTNGVLSGSVPVGEYEIYENGSTTNLLINVDSDSKEFEIDYYSVNVDIKSDVNTDAYVLDGTNYTTDKSIVVLNGSEVTIKAIPSGERTLAEAQLEGGSLELDQVLSSYNFVVNSTTDVYLEFDYVTYDVDVNFYLDDAIYENLIGDFRVLDSDDKEVTNVYLTNGVVHFNGKADNYELYYDGKLVKEMAVISTNRSFEVDYYSVNLDFDKVFDTDMVEINSSCFGGDTAVNEIVVLAGEDVDLKAIPSDEVKVTEFTINGTAGNVNELLAGTKVNVTKKTNIVVKMDLVEYDFSLNTYLDEEVYTSNTNSYALYKDGNKVVDLNSNNGIYTGSVPADTYDLYINGNDSYNVVTVSDSINSYDLDYYSVSLEIKNPLNNSSVSVDGTSYDTSFSKGLVYLAGTDILVDFSADGDVIPVKYTINDKNGEFGSFVTVNETINLYVEFDYVDIDVVINVMLDDKAYTDVNYNYSLYKDGTKYIDLTKNNGVLSGSVKSGKYEIYEGASTTRKYIEVSNTNKVFELNYYTVNVDIDSEVNTDSYMINGSTYNDDQSIISLEGKEVIVSATPSEGRKLVDYRIDNVTQEFANTGVTDSFVTSGTTVLYFEFDHITYDVDVEFHLDNSIYSSIIGEVYVLDSSDNKVSNVEFVDGVVHFNGKADNYELYLDGKLVKEFEVTEFNKSFVVNYYSVNLDFDKILDDDMVEINGACFKNDTVLNEIVLLEGKKVTLKAIPSDEVKVSEFTINGIAGDIDKLLAGMSINVSEKTDIYVKMSTVEYSFKLNTYLDKLPYAADDNEYSLYKDGTKVVDLTKNSNTYTGNVPADKYKLYINGKDSNKEITVTDSNSSYELNYYTVSLEIENPLNNSVTVDGNSYTTGFTKELVYLADTKIEVDAIVDSETEVVKYTVNGTDSSFDDKVTVDEPINLYVEFDYKEFDIKVNVKLDDQMYTDVNYVYSLYKDDKRVIEFTNNNGVLSGKVINGRYEIYADDVATNKFIEVSSTSKEFELNYYSVNVDIKSEIETDAYVVDGQNYTNDKSIVVLSGDEVTIKAIPSDGSRLVEAQLDGGSLELDQVLNSYNFVVNSTTNVYLEFDYVTYDVDVNFYLDDVAYESLDGTFRVLDSDGKEVTNVSLTNGVIHFNGKADNYELYSDDKLVKEMAVTSTNTSFEVDYYSVNLDFDKVLDTDLVEINTSCFSGDTAVNEIVVLAGEEISLKAIPSDEVKVTEFTINGTDSNVDELLDGMKVNVSQKTDVYIKMSTVEYDFSLNTYLDEETYTTNTNSYALYREGNKVVDLTNNNGIYTGSVHADNYKLYINGEDSNKEITITKTNNTYELNYYSVSLEIKNPLNNSVTVDGNSYTTGFNKELIYLADTKIDVDAVVDTETKVVKYIVNGTDSSFDDKVTIDEPIKLYVEFDYKEFDIKVNVKLDNEMYTDVDHEYSLYKDDIKVIDLTNNNGVLSGKVINGRYEIYEDGIATNKFIEVSSTSKEFELNYYSVNVQLNNLAGLDKAIINNIDYTSKDNEFILLEGKEIAIKAVPDTHREVRIFTINETDSDINSLLDGASYTINEKTDIYIKFNIVEYSVLINILVDDVLDTEAPAIYSLYDLDGNKASNLSKENGVLSGSVGYGEYYIYSGTVNTNIKINITETDNEFDLLYYTVNLDIEPVNVLDYVTINGLEYTEDTVVKQIVVLKDEVVDVNAFASNDTEIYEFKVNGTDNELSFPKSIKVSTKTDLYVKYGNKKYDQVMNVYVDDVLIDDLSLVPDITLSKDDVIYDNESKLVNGNYEVLLDNESTGIYVSVISGKVDIYFYNLLLSGDNGIASLDGDGLYLKGTDVSVSAGLKSGYNFDGWYLTEQPYDTGLDIVINDIDARYELEAKTIALKPYEPVISPENLYYEYGYDGEKQIQLIVQPYQGTTINSYQWYKCEDDKCSSKVIIEGAVSKEYNPTDKNVGDYYYYCDVLITRDDNGEAINTGSVVKVVVSPITPIATLKDKVEYYTGSNIKANEVELDSIIENDKFNITYLYYLDEDYTIPTSRLNGGATVQGGEPAFVGVYYVKAVVDGNNNYYATVAYGKLTILENVLPDVPKDDDVVVNPPTADNIMIIVLALASGAILIKGVPYLAKRRY